MDPNEYQERAMAMEADQLYIAVNDYDQSPQSTRFTNGLVGLVDEVGELASLRKRWLEYGGEKPSRPEIVEECGDVLWRTCQILRAFGLTLEQAMEANLAKLEQVRYKGTVCNPRDAKEENRDRKTESEVMTKVLRAEDDGVNYEDEK